MGELMPSSKLARILIVDDLFGRSLPGGVNRDRSKLCAQYLLADVFALQATASYIRNRATPKRSGS
jgi:hypothetical protein